MMKKSTIILTLIFIGLLSFAFSSRALAALTTIYPRTGQVNHTNLILNPDFNTATMDADLELDLMDAEVVLERRLAQLNVPTPYQIVRHNDQLLVQLPKDADTPYVNGVLAHIGVVEFIDGGAATPPIGHRIEIGSVTNPDMNVYERLFTGEAVTQVSTPNATTGQIFYELELGEEAGNKVAEFVHSDTRNYICIAIDQEVVSCSKMYHWAEGTLEILPNLSSGTGIGLAELAIFLDSGPLPLALSIQ